MKRHKVEQISLNILNAVRHPFSEKKPPWFVLHHHVKHQTY